MDPYNSSNPQHQAPSLMRIEDVAERLKLGRSTVYKLIQHGVLRGVVHVGRSIRVRSTAVDEFIDQLPELDVDEADGWQLAPRYVEDVVGGTTGTQSSVPNFQPRENLPGTYRRPQTGR